MMHSLESLNADEVTVKSQQIVKQDSRYKKSQSSVHKKIREQGLEERKHYLSKKRMWGMLLFGPFILLGLTGLILPFWMKDADLDLFSIIFVVLVFTIIITSSMLNFMKRISKKKYHSFTGAYNQFGEHQCLFCGNKGVYKHTPYKTNTTIADCSKCGENLWKE